MKRHRQRSREEASASAAEWIEEGEHGEDSSAGFSGWQLVTSALLALAVGLCVLISVQVMQNGYVNIAGFSLFRVVTGSMEPTISVGEAIVCRQTAIESIQVGDIVCYRSQSSDIYGSIVTHRVVVIATDETGALYLQTQGDANVVSDPYPVEADDLVGRVIWYSGKESTLTNLLSFLTGKFGFFSCILLPVLFGAGLILQNAIKNLHRKISLVQSEWQQAQQTEPNLPLPGYTTLTQADYDEIFNALRDELLKELHEHATEDQRSDEPPFVG